MKSKEQSKGYEAVRACMVLPAVPILDENVSRKSRQEVRIRGVRTVTGNVAQAQKQANELLRRCQRRVRDGHPSAVLELLDMNPEFVMHAWVRETLFWLAMSGRLRRSRGRRRGTYKMHPLLVVGLVEQLLSSGQAPNLDQAFAQLEQLDVLPYYTAKRLFYQVQSEKRFRPVMLTFPQVAREVAAEEAALPLGREVLQPGGKITRNFEDPVLGNVEIVFEGRRS